MEEKFLAAYEVNRAKAAALGVRMRPLDVKGAKRVLAGTRLSDGFNELAAMNIQQSPAALSGLWIVYALVPVLGMALSTVFYLFYKLNDKDVQTMAKCNSGEITREEAETLLSRKY